ncbi:MAG: hypothetical protein ABI681_05495 [Gemmatimonadales bacterium]
MPFRVFFLAAVLSSPAAAQHADTTATKSALLAADRALARQTAKEGPKAVLHALEPGAAVLFPGQPVLRGASGSATSFIARYSRPSTYSWRPVHAVASTDGRFGCTMGYSRFANAADTAKAEHRGVYLTCWRRGKEGRWRIAGTQLNDSPPSPPVLADSATLPRAPHSATTSLQGSALIAAQDADSLFAVFGAQPSGPGPAFMRYAAADGMLISGDAFPRGPVAIGAVFAEYSPDRVITWRPMRAFGAGSGGLAFTVGHSVSGPRPGKTGPAIPGKYFSIWRQEPDGRWLYVFDLGSPRPPR